MEKIKRLKKLFINQKIDGYIIPKNDEFFGEYTPKFNDRLNYVTNFTGSYGFSLILKNKNYLLVDGRYTLQANKECGKIFRINTFPKNMPFNILKNKRLLIGFDPKLLTRKTLNIFFKSNKCKFIPINENLVDTIWKRKKKYKKKKFYILPDNYVGQHYLKKINKIVKNLNRRKADYQFISASENNAWLLNIRGGDANYTPLPYSYVLIDKNENVRLFCDLDKITTSLKKKIKKIDFHDINTTHEVLSKIKNKKFILDNNTCSIFFENIIKKNNKVINYYDPIYFYKSIKARKEIDNIKQAHIYDGIALTKYLLWLKKNFNRKNINELTASNKLFNFRKKNNKFKFSSFPTISSSGPNGAIIHYQPTNKTKRKLKNGDIYLVDSGGQYEFGTTDVTRTISLKNSNKRIKNIFTRVLKGHIAIANSKLKSNTSGSQLDFKARKYLREIGLDYAHGTGHGVGYFLNVHEGPHSISKNNKIIFQEGMVVSNEPGYYEKNNFGIRIENLIYVKKEKKRKYFENLTMVPIDKDLIDSNFLNNNEKNWLNSYHKHVFNKLKKAMNKTQLLELKKACSAI